MKSSTNGGAFRLTKRLFDIVMSLMLLLFAIAPLSMIAIAIWIDLGKPVFFCQQRPGKGGKIFCLIKFRTMRELKDSSGRSVPDGFRLTSIGRVLRRWSLDELPELWNVLKGDMSLVGPRPLLIEYLDRYTAEQARRHDVKPGITGWAQVNGRNAITWEQKFRFDVWYVDKLSFWLDLKIIAITIMKISSREGINQPGHATMEEFFGSAGD